MQVEVISIDEQKDPWAHCTHYRMRFRIDDKHYVVQTRVPGLEIAAGGPAASHVSANFQHHMAKAVAGHCLAEQALEAYKSGVRSGLTPIHLAIIEEFQKTWAEFGDPALQGYSNLD